MSTSAFRYPNHPPTPHQPEPMQECFAWWSKIHVSCPPPQRKIGNICFETGRLSDVIVRQIGLFVMSSGRATTQIPIARPLS